ncbi:hypothetical protein OU798_02195 [Prolixibacteraceae bacterium Z1-6]|uniref:Metallo-beta-lactamase domain-containing protein n=1 Tax=Draconibacterium aestuarii TaxID=2998507 RepID=A0A9X3FA58_9BACT|nr:hypothetical protein [Prolixibacteraceae bacterium Z1-6]
MKYLVILVLLFASINSFADYVRVRKNTSIREFPKSNSEKLELVSVNQELEVLDSGQQNRGYYHVKNPTTNIEGWIYRTLLEYMIGNLPVVLNGVKGIEITVIDVGAGLSCLIKLSEKRYMVYDAGNRDYALNYIKQNIPDDSEIEFLILSHTDSDHWGSAAEIIRGYKINRILYTDFRLGNFNESLEQGLEEINEIDYDYEALNLSESKIKAGEMIFEEDGVKLYFLSGFGSPPDYWEEISYMDSYLNNAVSIGVKLEFSNQSVLFEGDAVGRITGEDGCIATEKYLIDSLDHDFINSDVLIAAHHGADNASCKEFVEIVSPRYVVFSAGNIHKHPRESTARRFTSSGVLKKDIFRTDKGYYQNGGEKEYQREWTYLSSSTGYDTYGDDNIKIFIPEYGNLRIGYE